MRLTKIKLAGFKSFVDPTQITFPSNLTGVVGPNGCGKSNVIEAKSEDMRAFVEEAAGVSRYKERRKETEARIAETRENLERLQDVRDEVEKQIRHLQRQAATARRYQALKEQERRLAAELLALRLRDLDSGGKVHDAAVRGRELAMQEALAAQRAAEAAIEKQRAVQTAHGERLSAVQGRYYQVGADISRLEQSIEHTRELRERQRADLAQAQATLGELAEAQARVQALRTAQLGCEQRLEGARGAREAARGELTSLEALQAAALSDHAGQAAEWLRGAGLAARPRLAADLEVEPGWERAVETALGDYLEAVCVERLEELSGALAGLAAGRLTLVESGERARGVEAKTLAAHLKGPPAVIARLAAVSTDP